MDWRRDANPTPVDRQPTRPKYCFVHPNGELYEKPLEDIMKSDSSDANKRNEMEKSVRSCPILEKGLKEKKEQKAS
jgi:hypothetical protein